MKYWQIQKILNTWKTLTSGSINRRILGAAITVATLTALVKVVALVKELAVASKFGTGDTLDAFLIAWLVPAFLINVIAVPFKAAFIPTYIKVRENEGTAEAQKLFSRATIWSIGLLAIASVLMVVTAPWYLPLIASGFEPEKLALTSQLLNTSTPVVLLSGLVTLLSAILNAKERFAAAALSPIITPVTVIIFLFIFNSWAIFALVAGLCCGILLEIVFLGAALHRQGISLRLGLYKFDDHLREVTSQYAPMVAGAFLMCSSGPVDQSMAAMLSAGSVSALNYGNRLIISLLSLIATALGTAVIPYFSKMIVSENWVELRQTFSRYVQLIFILTVPLTGILLVFSEPIVKLVFQRGSFTSEDTSLVAQIQALYSLQIPFYIGDILIVGLIKSLNLSRVLIWVCGLNLSMNIALNYIFMNWIGVRGIALSTSCVYFVSFLCVFFFAQTKLRKFK